MQFTFTHQKAYISQACHVLFFWVLSFTCLYAHEIRPAYLQIDQQTDSTYSLMWKVPMLYNKVPDLKIIWPDGFVIDSEVIETLADANIKKWKATYRGDLGGEQIQFPNLQNTLIDVLIQVKLHNDISYSLIAQPKESIVTIPIQPSKWQVVKLYTALGIEHILIGFDHLLFVLCLLLIIEGIPLLIKTITAFTIAHSVTLGLAALDVLHIPGPPVEAVIALSIIFLSREYFMKQEGKQTLSISYPWLVALVFGLLHGLGFAGALSEIGLPQKEVPAALLTFNIGVEIGQLLFVSAILLIAFLWRRLKVKTPPFAPKLLAYATGSIASFWLIERIVQF